jgi:hypothetical protein
MPLGTPENVTYLSIGWGKLRKKAQAMAEGVVERTTQKGEKSLAYEYSYVEGKITKIYRKESKEYGNSFEVRVDDGKDKFSVSFKEGSRSCQDLLTKLPNIDLNQPVKISPFQMMNEKTGKEFRGVSIQQNGVKIPNAFSAKVGENEWKYYHGYPEPTKKNMNETELKIYFLMVTDFLTKYTIEHTIKKLVDESYSAEIVGAPDHVDGSAADDENSDLPF